MHKQIDDLIILCTTAVLNIIADKNLSKKLSFRVNPYLKERKSKGRFVKDFQDMMDNTHIIKENFHMTPEALGEIFELVEPFLRPKKNTRPDDKISALEKFAVAIEYLASGTIQRHVASIYRISKQHIGKILEIPSLNATEFVKISNEFNTF